MSYADNRRRAILDRVRVKSGGVFDYKVPSQAEWQDEVNTWSSISAEGAIDSILKLPMASYKTNVGNLQPFGYYWTSTSIGNNSIRLFFRSSFGVISGFRRSAGMSIRLIKEGDYASNPNETIEINELSYQTVFNPITGRVWLDRNLGATQVATSSTDADAYGWLYQWGRATDGHQLRDSLTHDGDTLGKPSTYDESGAWDEKFILTTVSPYDWLDPKNDNLWQGVDGLNNPTK